MKSRLELAANLFAASFLEVCPEVVFTAIWTGHLGFYVDYTLPFPMTDEFLKIIEERMREKIKKRESSQIFEMSSRNIVECLKEMKQFKLARELDRSRPSRNIIKIGSYVGVLEDEIDPDLSQIGAIGLEKRGSLVYGVAFEEKEDLKKFRRALKEAEKEDQLVIGDQERFFEKEGEDIYWLPEGVKFRKRIEKKIESFLKELGYEEVEFSGNIEWYEKKGLTKIFTTLEEESDTTFECGLKDQALQKVYYVANSSLQMFQDFAKIISLIFEFQDTQIVCKDFYGIDWGVISQEESGVKISVDRIAAMLVEKRDFLVC